MAKRFGDNRLNNVKMGSIEIDESVASALEYSDLFAAISEPKEEPAEVKIEPEVAEVTEKPETKEAIEPIIEQKEEEKPKNKKEVVASEKPSRASSTSARTKKTEAAKEPAKAKRKKLYEEERKNIQVQIPKEIDAKLIQLVKKERTNKTQILLDIMAREKALYEKDNEAYIKSRTPKIAKIAKMEAGEDVFAAARAPKSISDFIFDVHYDLDCTIKHLVMMFIEVEHEKVFGKQS